MTAEEITMHLCQSCLSEPSQWHLSFNALQNVYGSREPFKLLVSIMLVPQKLQRTMETEIVGFVHEAQVHPSMLSGSILKQLHFIRLSAGNEL